MLVAGYIKTKGEYSSLSCNVDTLASSRWKNRMSAIIFLNVNKPLIVTAIQDRKNYEGTV